MLAHFGGNWNNGSNAGFSYWNLNNSSSNANVNIGRQTLISSKKINLYFAHHLPYHLVKIRPKRAWFSRFFSKHHEANKKDAN